MGGKDPVYDAVMALLKNLTHSYCMKVLSNQSVYDYCMGLTSKENPSQYCGKITDKALRDECFMLTG